MTLAKIYTNGACVLIDLDKISAVKVYCKTGVTVFINSISVVFVLSQDINKPIEFIVDFDGDKYSLPIRQYSGKAKKLINSDLFEILTKKQTDINIQDIVMTTIYKLREIDDNS